MKRALAVLSISAAVLATAPLDRAGAVPGSPETAIVSLGDSFISGEGGRWMGNGSDPWGARSGTDRAAFGCDGIGGCSYDPYRVYGASEGNGCHRSDVAPILSAPVAVEAKVNLACSGAKAENIWRAESGGRPHRDEPAQADRLAGVARRYDVSLVVLTVGANDVGFGELVVRCALDWVRSDEDAPILCRGAAQDELASALPDASRRLRKALAEIRAAMAQAGYSRDRYRLILAGYASPFPAGASIRYPEWGWSRLRLGGCPLWDADADWAREEATPALVMTMATAAERAGAEFLDLQHAFDGHQLCDRRARRVGPAGPTPRTAEWFRRLSFAQGSVRESLHPNAYGQRAMGACIALAFVRARGDYACHATPGRDYTDGMRLVPLP